MGKNCKEIRDILIQSVSIPVELIDNNTGQIPGVNANPREMTDTEFRKLKKSLLRDPGFTALSELKVYPLGERWVTIGGNMRLRAIRELGWREAVCKPIPAETSPETLNRYILLDNVNFGKWDFDRLASEWDVRELADMCIDIPADDGHDDLEGKEGGQDEGGIVKKSFTLAPEQVTDIRRILAQGRKRFAKTPVDPMNPNSNAHALTGILREWTGE